MYFDIAYTYYRQTNDPSNVDYDSLGIAVSLDCGENWGWFWKEGGIELATVDGGLGTEFVPENDEWEQKVISLSDLNGQSSVNFAFIAIKIILSSYIIYLYGVYIYPLDYQLLNIKKTRKVN